MIDLNTIELLTIFLFTRISLRKLYHNEIAFTYNDI